ncbi:MAG: hypothetical protein A2033_10015 [Bacteroidetes bacterium GWA2_31_9]|nr:MAG: hypothetical protein A2033_10015 [Bacteroidetes bacterium GWA2_31_9]
MIIRVVDITNDYYSGISGLKVGKYIDKAILDNPETAISVSFYGIESIAPSFVNGALLYIVDLYGVDFFKSKIKIIEVSSKVQFLIKDNVLKYFDFKNSFMQQLKAKNFYLAIDGSNESESIKQYLKNLNKSESLNINFNNDFIDSNRIKQYIKNTDCVIFILSEKNYSNIILELLSVAIQNNLPCILLIKKGVYINLTEREKDKVFISRFDNKNIIKSIRDINEIVLKNNINSPNIQKAQLKRSKNTEPIIFWSALAFLANLLFSSMLVKSKK